MQKAKDDTKKRPKLHRSKEVACREIARTCYQSMVEAGLLDRDVVNVASEILSIVIDSVAGTSGGTLVDPPVRLPVNGYQPKKQAS